MLERDQHQCQLKMDGCTTYANHAHHLDPRWKYGDDPARIIAACNPCNQKAGSPDTQPEPKRITRW